MKQIGPKFFISSILLLVFIATAVFYISVTWIVSNGACTDPAPCYVELLNNRTSLIKVYYISTDRQCTLEEPRPIGQRIYDETIECYISETCKDPFKEVCTYTGLIIFLALVTPMVIALWTYLGTLCYDVWIKWGEEEEMDSSSDDSLYISTSSDSSSQ